MLQFQFTGNLTADPVLRRLESGVAVCNFSVAVNERYTNADGERTERVHFMRISAWRQLAETCGNFLTKGRKVLVTAVPISDANGGPRVWTDSDGNARSSWELRATNVEFLDRNPNGGANHAAEPPVSEEDFNL